MDKFFIVGGNHLNGEIEIDSAKNSLLPIIAACILVEDEIILKKVPKYSDVIAMCKILENLGGKVDWQEDNLIINCKQLSSNEVPNELASPVRASIFTLGAIISRLKSAKVSYPGGCDIGLRPIDIHLNGLKSLGCKIVEKNGYIYADGTNAKSGDFMLSFPSVGATENLMMFASLLEGETRIFNPAREPEIVDLQNFINKCGGDIHGAGSNMIVVNGVERLKGCEYQTIPDRIETGTYMIATAMCGGRVVLKNTKIEHNQVLMAKLINSHCKVFSKDDKIIISSSGRPHTFGEIETAVYPGFPTDLQAQMMALASISKGYSLICENLFESRFKHVGELIKLGADIRCKNGICIVSGKKKLYGANVSATDLRGGASLVLAGLVAEGYTTIANIELIDRGYFKIEEKLSHIGGDISRIKENKN